MSDESPELIIRRLEHELLAHHRLALLGNMAAMISHEFNNLMTPVLARAQDALTHNDPAAGRKALERTVHQTQRATQIARQLLDLARGVSPDMSDCRVRDVVNEAIESAARPLDRDGIELVIEVPDEVRIRASALLAEQVLLNLIINARNAMKPRGGRLALRARRDGEHVLIDVRDNGQGIDPQRIEGVINPFLADDGEQRATDWQSVGLGLNVCRTIARSHGASLRAIANDGPGCTFQLRWPAA
ncbi:MAG: HAMP domain-containing sensor histidine kinase [Phycisphaerae bacterium]